MEGEADLRALSESIACSFEEGFLCLFMPPTSMIMKWIDVNPSYFTSDEERADFIDYVSDERRLFEEKGESEADGEDEAYNRVRSFLEQATTNFCCHILSQLAPFFLSIDGHPPFYKSADETAECRRKRVYETIHAIVYNEFLGLFTEIDNVQNRQVVQEVADSLGGVTKHDEILQRMISDNEYAAKAVQLAADTACGMLCDEVLNTSTGIQKFMQNYLAELTIRAQSDGLL